MKYSPGKHLVPELHSSGFNLLSALGCGRVGIPFLDMGVGRNGAEKHKGRAYLFGGVCVGMTVKSLQHAESYSN